MGNIKLNQIEGCVFIVTYGRSGSTLLQRIMQTIPGMCFRGENSGALEMLYRSALCASETRNEFGQWKLPSESPWHGANLINPTQYSAALAEVFINQILNPGPKQKWIGFKEIRYDKLDDELFSFLDWIFETFPNPYFLFNTRNHSDVANSAWWAQRDPDKVMTLLEKLDKRFELYHWKRPDRSFINTYEQLTENPQSIEPFFRKMGVPYDGKKIKKIMQDQLIH
ncbi:MAG: sulfotransferase [Anderseniella sp.]